MVKYSIIIPTYEERRNITLLLTMIDSYLNSNNNAINYEVVVVDDNSPDGTADEVLKIKKYLGNNKIKLLKRPGLMGLGTAYIDGYKLCEGDYIFLMDADFSHHPKFLINYIDKQKETKADIVTGSRYIKDGGVYGWSVGRKLISRCANYFASFFLNPKVSDLTGSFRLYTRKAFEKLIKDVQNVGYAFQMEIIVKAEYNNYVISEVPITFVDRIYGRSKLSLKEILIFFQTVLKLYCNLDVKD